MLDCKLHPNRKKAKSRNDVIVEAGLVYIGRIGSVTQAVLKKSKINAHITYPAQSPTEPEAERRPRLSYSHCDGSRRTSQRSATNVGLAQT